MHYLSKCEDATCGKTYPADLHNCPHCGADSAFSSIAPLDPKWWPYDIETYPNIFTATFIHAATGMELVYEISDRKNQQQEMVDFMFNLGKSGAWGVGFNNMSFDYPVLHFIAHNPGCTVKDIYDCSQRTIKASNVNRWSVMVWDRDQIFPQLDLLLLNHFDNKARMTSLKALEVAMKSPNVKDLPFPVGMALNDAQKDELITYNIHDVRETTKFMIRCLSAIQFREELCQTHGRNFMNHNDTKIGKDYFVMELEKNGIQCFNRDDKGRKLGPRQTPRESICFADVIFPYIKFDRPEFNEILKRFQSKTIYKKELDELEKAEGKKDKLVTKGVFSDLECTINGYTFVFGVGGIHGSVESQIVETNDIHQLVDIDVSSMYPSIAIANRIYPEHLGEKFCDINEYFFNERMRVGKKTTPGAVYKLSMNGVYGDSNNAFGPFYDPKYTMTVTVNGQLMLAMLCERLLTVPGLTIVQSNTDGVTMLCPHVELSRMRALCKQWEAITKLELEEVFYKRMPIRDVNNYLALDNKGNVKRKGAYEYEYQWHQDPSATIVGKAAEAALLFDTDIRTFITQHRDPFDFMLRAKVPRSARLIMRWPEWGAEQEMQNTTRVFISRNGGSLVKLLPPTGVPGTWKRKNGIKDDVYNAVMREITGQPGNVVHYPAHVNKVEGYPDNNIPDRWELILPDGTSQVCDSIGTPWDERIHTKSRSKHDAVRETGMYVGWKVTECADAKDFDWGSLDYEYYVKEAEKLVLPLLGK